MVMTVVGVMRTVVCGDDCGGVMSTVVCGDDGGWCDVDDGVW